MGRIAGLFTCAFVATAVAAGLQPGVAVPAGVGSQLTLSSLEIGILGQLNEIRIEHGLVPLKLNPSLATAASDHCAEMGAGGFFSHYAAGGVPFVSRIRRYYPSAGYSYWSVGENLLWASGSVSATQAVGVWMASAEHRTNLLSSRWREIGIAAVAETDAPGVFDHLSVEIVATDFGVRR